MRKAVVLILVIVLLLAPSAVADYTLHVKADVFSQKFDAFIKNASSSSILESFSIEKETSDGLLITKYQGEEWGFSFTSDDQGIVTRLTGSVPSTLEYVSYYNAVLFGLSKYEVNAAMFFWGTPEAKRAASINLWLNGYERFMTFSEESSGTRLHFDFRTDMKRSTQFLNPGEYEVGKSLVYAGEYVATASDKPSSIRIYRKRKLVFSSMLNRNADTNRIVLFDGDIIEVSLNTAIMRLVME